MEKEVVRDNGHVIERVVIIILLCWLLIGVSIGLSVKPPISSVRVGRAIIPTALISPETTVLSAHSIRKTQ